MVSFCHSMKFRWSRLWTCFQYFSMYFYLVCCALLNHTSSSVDSCVDFVMLWFVKYFHISVVLHIVILCLSLSLFLIHLHTAVAFKGLSLSTYILSVFWTVFFPFFLFLKQDILTIILLLCSSTVWKNFCCWCVCWVVLLCFSLSFFYFYFFLVI